MKPSCRIGVATLCAALLASLASAAEWVLTGSLLTHDPTIIQENGAWWCFHTGQGLQTKSSSDGLAWTQRSPLFPAELGWWRTYAPNMGPDDVWAPDLHAFNGRVWCYYAVSEFGKNNSAIGLKSCTTLAAGDWRDDGLVISSHAGTDAYNAIDPNLTIDADGNPWLAFGSWFDGIQIVALDPATMKPKGAIQRIAKRDGGIEAANIVYANGTYTLFVSIDLCCQGVNSTYKIAYGRSHSITGPYVDKNGTAMTTGGYSLLEVGGDRWKGPGGEDVCATPNGWVIARHAYDANANGAPTLRIADLYFDADGWPTFTGAATPSIVREPAAVNATAGLGFALGVQAIGPGLTYQWMKDGTAIAGARSSSLSVPQASVSDAGSYTVVVTNANGTTTSRAAAVAVTGRPDQVLVSNGDPAAQIVNLSTRGIVTDGENALIAGFVVTGSASKRLLIQVSGPTLRRVGLTGEIGRPHLQVMHHVDGTATPIAENSNWQLDQSNLTALETQLGAQLLTASTDDAHRDAGLILDVQPGVYSVVVTPDAASANRDGIALLELYDAAPGNGSRLVDISSRGRIETGDRQMFVGVVTSGPGPARLLVRGVGPALGPLGIQSFLSNPSETLYQSVSGNQVALATNDDAWNSAQADQMAELATKFGAFALPDHGRDASMLVRVDPGVYSAIIAPVDGNPGIALAEVYDVTDRDSSP